MGEALDDLYGEGSWRDVEALANLLADESEGFRVGEDFGGDDLAGLGRQTFKRVGELVGAGCALLGRCGVSHRWSVGSSGGFGLFCLVLQEGHEHLVGAHLFALRAVEAFEQGGDESLPDVEFSLEGGDFRSQFGDLLLGRFDGFQKQRECQSWV